MRLAIITDCTHYTLPGGGIGTENHILLRQFSQLCSHFSSTIICCPFGTTDSSRVLSTYTNETISFYQLPVVGGDTIKDKLKIASILPLWVKAFKKLNEESDIVYQRFPNNLNIPGFLYFLLKKKKVFATYTGTWSSYNTEPLTYRLQRWILRKPFRGPVWVYTDEENTPSRIKQGFSPSYSMAEWEEETEQVAQRKVLLQNGLPLLRMITVGTLIDYKNQQAIIEACKILHEKKIPFQLSIVGDGPMRSQLQAMISGYQLNECVHLLGKKNHVALRQLYRQHDIVVQAPLKEGFGKVPIEGFFHGVVPVINNTAMAGAMIGNNERGFLFDAGNLSSLATHLENIYRQPQLLLQMIDKGRAYAKAQTLEAWADDYYKTILQYYSEVE